LRVLRHLHADLGDTGIFRSSAPEILEPLAQLEGAQMLSLLLRHLHGDVQDLGEWQVHEEQDWALSHPEHAPWQSTPTDMLQHLRAIEVKLAQLHAPEGQRLLHIDREIQYTVERGTAGLVLEVMVSHSFAWYPVRIALSALEVDDWIVFGPSSTRPLADAFLADQKGFMSGRG
jgi:hypothetical protein